MNEDKEFMLFSMNVCFSYWATWKAEHFTIKAEHQVEAINKVLEYANIKHKDSLIKVYQIKKIDDLWTFLI